MQDKPIILIITHIDPTLRNSGQSQRVYYTLLALKKRFRVIVMGFVQESSIMQEITDEIILIPSIFSKNLGTKIYYRLRGLLFQLYSGLRFSNYILGSVEFGPERIVAAVQDIQPDLVLFEYWHASKTAWILEQQGQACILDMHNILWQSYVSQLENYRLPSWITRWLVQRYRQAEESAWSVFSGVITINNQELEYINTGTNPPRQLYYTPMGIELENWPYNWQPQQPHRIGYYGGLGSVHNQKAALQVIRQVMPHIWRYYPDTECWIVGNRPGAHIQLHTSDPRIKVTGFVDDVQAVLRTLTVLICPWSGTYGFRSRLVEVASIGVPIVTTADAVYGMDFTDSVDILIGDNIAQLTDLAITLLDDPQQALRQSIAARRTVERFYCIEQTYDQLALDLYIQVRGKR